MSPDEIRVPGTSRVYSRRRILIVLLLPLAMALIAVSAINVALPAVATGLGASDSQLQWVVAGYALTFGVFLVPAGRAGDVLGRGVFYVAGVVIFTAASLWCGLATNPTSLNIARALAGLGAGFMNPQSLGMVQQYFSGLARARAFALFGMVISLSVAFGPVLSGTVITWLGPQLGWRASFLVNVPLGLLAIALSLTWLPFQRERELWRSRRTVGSPTEKIDLDPLGAIVLSASVASFMWPFMTKGSSARWIALPLSALLAWTWVVWERRYASSGRSPLIRLELFSLPSFAYGTAISGLFFLGAPSVFVTMAIFLQSGLGTSAMIAGLIGLPNALASAICAGYVAKRVLRTGPLIVVISVIAALLGVAASALVIYGVEHWGLSFWWLLATLGLMGAGQGAFGAANQTLALADVPPEDGGAAGGVKSTAERLGTAVGVAVVTGVLFSVGAMAGWTWGAVAACLVNVAFLLLSLIGSLRDWARSHPREAAH
ncbi:MAG: MFS transporter [Flaviflexus sp.]|nr:MFS transporter [Flaviflexus sp.]